MKSISKITEAVFCVTAAQFKHSLICHVKCRETCSDSKDYELRLAAFLEEERKQLFSGQIKLFKKSDIEKHE